MASPTAIAAYLALFAAVGFLFLFANLVLGRFLRPCEPNAEKLEVYECGEPTIGSSFVQFDLRFYVVALLFIIFDVEVAFFFPWATVFGKATDLTNPNLPVIASEMDPPGPANVLSPRAMALYRELGVANPTMPMLGVDAAATVRKDAQQLANFAFADIAVFFGVLLVGFAYVWRRGDLDWVRAVRQEPLGEPERLAPGHTAEQEEPALSR